MKHIQKKISLEQFKSRMPSIIPSFYAIGKYYEFDGKANFDENGRIPYTNYDMIPYSVKWNRGKYIYRVDANGDEHAISYNTIASWFHFIEFYINLLSKNGCLDINYESATDYSKYENNENYSYEDYENFDKKILEICGNFNETTLYNSAVDTYDYMINNYFPRFKISKKYQEVWHKKYLSFNEVNYWINWFDSHNLYNNIDNCIDNENCCDCEKFFKLGGKEMLNNLKKFIMEHFLINRIDKGYVTIDEVDNWIEWFENEYKLLGDINTINECYKLDNCEDCIKYFKLGGYDTLEYLKKIKENIILKFSDENGILYISKIRKLKSWFGIMSNKLNGINDISECEDTDYCEDCKKFFNLGGEETFKELCEFIYKYDSFFIYVKPTFSINIKLQSTIDDLGEFSIFYDEWEGGVDYSHSNGEITNGAIVQHNNQDWILDNGKGYIYSTKYKEYYFGNKLGMEEDEAARYDDNEPSDLIGSDNQFSRLIEKNAISNDGKIKYEFNGNITINEKYAYTYYGKKITFVGDVTNDICKEIYQKFQINYVTNGFFVINGAIYECKQLSYIIYNNNYYEVTLDAENNPISNINGVNYYAIFNGTNFTFNINNEELVIYNGNGINLGNILLLEENGKITYKNCIFNKIFYYSDVKGETILLNNDLVVISQKLIDNEYNLIIDDMIIGEYLTSLNNLSNGYTTDDNYLYIASPFNIYNMDEITGYTESKLSSFIASTDIVYDNLGNKLQGTYISQEIKNNDTIGLIYKPNTAIHLSKENDNRYWGDYLSDIILYYVDINNNDIKLTSEKKLNVDGNLIEIISSLNNELGKTKNGALVCKFIYYMGCVIDINECGDSNCIDIIEEGVKYVDIVKLNEKFCKYFFNDYTYCTLRYYDIEYDEINYKNDTYNFSSYVNKSQFTTKITTFMKNNKFNCNGWVDFPVIKEEYKLGSSSLSNIDVDVNIDRGTARAFDQHIKLLEVNSLESLEQYGNGYFNIITN